MNTEILATPNAGRASTPGSEWIIVEPPKDLILVLKGLRPNPACNRCETDARVLFKCSASSGIDGNLLFHGACAECRLAGLKVECSFHESFSRIGSEEALSLRDRSNSVPQLGDDAESTARLLSSRSSLQLRSLSPPQRNPTPPRAVRNGRNHKRKARKVQQRGGVNYKKGLMKVTKFVCGDLNISKKALHIMNEIVNDMFDSVAEEAAVISVLNNTSTISRRAMETAFRLVMGFKEDKCNEALAPWEEFL